MNRLIAIEMRRSNDVPAEEHDQEGADDDPREKDGVLKRVKPGASHIEVSRRDFLQQKVAAPFPTKAITATRASLFRGSPAAPSVLPTASQRIKADRNGLGRCC